MNVSFVMKSRDGRFTQEYEAPLRPRKPNSTEWSNRQEKEELKRQYAKDMSAWKEKLRPIPGSQSLGVPLVPEGVLPNLISSSYPYPNLLAHSVYDMKDIIIDNLDKHKVPDGVIKIHTHASDGCDGFGDWDLVTEKTNVDLPDHGLSYDCKILKV